MGGCDRRLLHPLLTQGWWLWHRSAAVASKFTNGSLGDFPQGKGRGPLCFPVEVMFPQLSCKPTRSKEQAQVG